MTRKNFFFLLLSIAIIGSSCDPGVQYKRIIQNNSGYDLKIYVYNDTLKSCNYFYDNDSFLVANKSETVLATGSKLGHAAEFENCESCADSIISKVVGNDTMRLTINLNDPSFWNFKNFHKGVCECRLIITNDDIK